MLKLRHLYGVTSDRINARPVLARWLLAGPGALLAAFLFMAAMPVWFPAGDAGVNNIALPLVFAPLFWTIAFIYTCLEENLPRGSVIIVASIIVQAAIVALAFA